MVGVGWGEGICGAGKVFQLLFLLRMIILHHTDGAVCMTFTTSAAHIAGGSEFGKSHDAGTVG